MFSLFVSLACAIVVKFKGDKQDIPVTYYSMVKPCHVDTSLCLSSLEIAYNGGSKQQMTRAVRAIMLSETLWTIYPGRNITHVHQGAPVKCGDRVRFHHATTHMWLHSHNFDSQLGNGLEVSAVPNAEDDENDWIVECVGEDDEEVTMGTPVLLRHALVNCYLATNGDAEYPPEVAGNWEVYCDDNGSDGNEWRFDRGIVVAGEAEEDDNDYGYDDEYDD